MVAVDAADPRVTRDGALAEIECWKRLGVAVVPGQSGTKGPWPRGWPSIPQVETWRLSGERASRGPLNLAARLGPTVDGQHILGHVDFDGIDGIDPDAALARAQVLFPGAPLLKTSAVRWRMYFWSTREIPDCLVRELGAEVAANAGRLSIVHGVHPSGSAYEWITPPTGDLPLIDVDALGLVIERKAPRPLGTRSRPASPHAASPRPADAKLVAFFSWLFAGLGLYEGQGDGSDLRGEFFLCPWHRDTEASLHVLWESAVFCCQGCGRSGGVRELRTLIADESSASPRKLPNDDSGIPSGNRVTNGGTESLVERIASLADQLPPRTFNVTGLQLRECRQHVLTYQCDVGHEFAPRDERGNPTPLSCDASSGICVRCGRRRFLLDARAADTQLSERVQVFRLIAHTPGRELFDLGLCGRLTDRLKTYRKSHGLTAGSAARSLHLDPDGSAFRGHFIVAIPCGDAALVVTDGTFSVDDLGECSLERWHQLQIAEHTEALGRLETPEQLEAFYLAMHGQQQFRHFGAWYGKRTVDRETGEVVAPKNAGGASSSRHPRAPSQVICPLHPGAQVRRSTTPALASSLIRGDGGVLIPRPPEHASAPVGGGR